MREFRDNEEVDFAIVGTGCGGSVLAAKLAEAGYLGGSPRRGPVLAAALRLRLRRARAGQALLARRADLGRRRRDRARREQLRSGGRRVHGALPDGLAALPPRLVQGAHPARLRRRLAGRCPRRCGATTPRWSARSASRARSAIPGGRRAGAIPTAPTRSTPRGSCSCAGPRRWASTGRRRRSAPSRRRAARARPASIAACARSAARPTPSSRCWSPTSPARSPPGRRCATSPWWAGSGPTRRGGRDGVEYHRDGRWRFQRARHVVVSGYSIETPRLLLNSATGRHPRGLGNGNDQVGRYLMVHSNHAVWGELRRGDPLVQGAALDGLLRALELRRRRSLEGLRRRLFVHEPGAAARPTSRARW